MDSNCNPGPQSQSHAHNGQTPTTLQNSNSTTATPKQPIHLPVDISTSAPQPQPTSPLRTTNTYEYQSVQPPAPSSPGKRSSDAQAEDSVKDLKRLRLSEEPEDTVATTPKDLPTPPAIDVTQKPVWPESKPVRPTIERNSSLRFDKPASTHKQHYRSRSLPATLTGSRRKRRSADSAAAQHVPPVTLATLRELDLNEIYRNPKLRHDVVFDSQLHFRPNLDGSRGRRKKEQSDMYWKLVLRECEMLFANLQNKNKDRSAAEHAVKLPLLFSTMRDILLTLVPKSDRREVEDALDPPLLIQQLEHGVLDFKKLSTWLATVLKAHCAPMRDQFVEQMVSRISFGVDTGRTQAFVDGLKIVFGILEAMKLDVANHQIRTLRPHLVSTAVQFEQGYFQDKIDSGRLDMSGPRAWFLTAAFAQKDETDPYMVFSRAVTEMLTPSRNATYPATWTFDVERLDGLRDDIREATCLKLAIVCFRHLTMGARRDLAPSDVKKLRETLLAILSDEEGPQRWNSGSDAVALHIAQAANEFNGKAGIPTVQQVDMAQGWFSNHLRLDSPIYKMVEREIVNDINKVVLPTMKGWANLSTSPIMQAADVTGSSVELESISQRIAYISFLHWRIFGKMYTSEQPPSA